MAKRLRQTSISSNVEEEVDNNSSRSQSIEPAVHTPKYASLEPPDTAQARMRCSLPPHRPLTFPTYAEYEKHYQHSHTNRCTDCLKNFPTTTFLDLHIAENHDPIVASKREAGERTYACFVEGCEKVCSEWKKRRSHLVDKHGYPRNYDFLVVDHGVDGRRSMLRAGVDAEGHRKSSRERGRSGSEATLATDAASVDENDASVEMEKVDGKVSQEASTTKAEGVDELTSSFSTLKMVPRSVTFGKRKGRSGFAKS